MAKRNEYIYERKGKNGTTLQVKVPYSSDGKRSFRCTSVNVSDYPTKSAAYEYARMVRDQYIVDARIQNVARNKTVAELYSDYWNVSPNSIRTKVLRQPVYNATVRPLENKNIQDISPFDIQNLITVYSEDHSEKRISEAIGIWRDIFRTAQMQGVNVADKTLMLLPIHSRAKIKRKKRERVVTYDEFIEFTTALLTPDNPLWKIDHDLFFMLWIMYLTGARPAEVLALNAGDIDFDNHFLTINKSIGATRTELRQIVTTKSPRGIRRIPIRDELETVLRALLAYSNSAPLIRDADGLPYDIDRLTSRVKRVRAKTGIPFNAYQLRHKFSDDMFEKKVSPVVVRDLMGHASISMSLDYATSTDEQKSNALESRLGTIREQNEIMLSQGNSEYRKEPEF